MVDSVDIRTKGLKKPVDVAEYLFKRLHQVGVRSVHGLPGDYNLVALDYLPKANLKWIGSVNELNAAYAADGYARVKGISALITTFGVGELSAINGVAGAYAEHVPVVHIVGGPSTISQKNGMMLHHTLGNGDFNVFANMNKEISVALEKLYRPNEIADQIDSALRECYLKSRPVYLLLPTDMVQAKIEGERLDTPIDLSDFENDPEKEDYVVDVVLKYLHNAKNPIMLVDACAIRHRVVEETKQLVDKTKLPVFVTPMGKGAIDESHPCYGGVYAGEGSLPEVTERVEAADLILTVGALKSDFNTAGFSYRTSQISSVYIGLQVLYVIMMYISVYPVVITMRNSNVYEERSLGIYADDSSSDSSSDIDLETADSNGHPLQTASTTQSNYSPTRRGSLRSPQSIRPTLIRRVSSSVPASQIGRAVRRSLIRWHGVGVPTPPRPSSPIAQPAPRRSHATRSPNTSRESRINFISQQIHGQLAHDIWWLVLAVLIITTIETSHFNSDPVTYSVFNVIFEVVSAYGCVGISVGLPNAAYSFSGAWHAPSKLVLVVVMLRGRHRGLPVALDRAVRLPGDQLHRDEDEDWRIRRSMTQRRMSGE